MENNPANMMENSSESSIPEKKNDTVVMMEPRSLQILLPLVVSVKPRQKVRSSSGFVTIAI